MYFSLRQLLSKYICYKFKFPLFFDKDHQLVFHINFFCDIRRVAREFRGKVGSDGFEKVLIGTRGAREAFLDGWEGRAAKNSVLTSGAKQLKC